jgi:hypothetical protein
MMGMAMYVKGRLLISFREYCHLYLAVILILSSAYFFNISALKANICTFYIAILISNWSSSESKDLTVFSRYELFEMLCSSFKLNKSCLFSMEYSIAPISFGASYSIGISF